MHYYFHPDLQSTGDLIQIQDHNIGKKASSLGVKTLKEFWFFISEIRKYLMIFLKRHKASSVH